MSTAMSTAQNDAYLAESRQNEVYASHITFFLLSMLALACRFWAARIAEKRLWWDDWFALIAGVFDVGVFTVSMLWLRFGLGRHAAWALEEDPLNLVRFFQAIMANEILYTTALACARLSIVCFYYRIFGVTAMRYYLHFLVIFIIAWAISTYGPSIFACWPVEDFWGLQKECINLSNFYIGVAVGSILTDVSLIVLPLPFIWKLQTSYFNKFLTVSTFFFGGFNCFVTGIRLHIVSALDLSDPTYNTTDLMIWTGLELYCAVICCCLPTLAPLILHGLKKIGLKSWLSVGGSNSKKKSYKIPAKHNSASSRGAGRLYPEYQQRDSSSIKNILAGDGINFTELRTIGGGKLENE